MSRCFPFPPPGYEKKARTDDVDLLKKEKHRDKKHKKEKKDKEKKEGKDRKEKDKSDEKHRDKKDRKEKSKEKKKDREKDKHRDKTSTSQEERKIPAQVESCNGDHNLNHKERERVKDQNITSNEKKQNTPSLAHTGDKPVQKSLFDERSIDKFVLDLCSRIEDEEKGPASQSVERNPFAGRTNHERMVRNETGTMVVEMENKKDRRVDDIRKMDGQGVRVGATISAAKLVQNIVGKGKMENHGVHDSGGFQNRAEENPKILENGIEPRDKNHKKNSEDKRGSKRTDKDKEKKSHGKDKEREKQKKKEEKAREKSLLNIKDHDKVKGSTNNGHVVGQDIKLPPLVSDGKRNPVIGDRNLIVGQNTKLPPFVPFDSEKNPVIRQNIKLPQLVPNGLPQLVPNGDRNFTLGQNAKLPPFVQDGDKNVFNSHSIKLTKVVPNGNKNFLGPNTNLPPFAPDSDKNLFNSQNTKLPKLVPDCDKKLYFGQNAKLPPFVPEIDKRLVNSQAVKFPKLVPDGDKNLIRGQNTKLSPLVPNGDGPPAIAGTLKKRKDIEANGFLHETNTVPNKKPRPTPHPSQKNGRKLEPCQAPVLYTPDSKALPPNNEHKINGKIEAKPLSISLKKPSSSSSSSSSSKTKADQSSQAPSVKKPPHPDAKYLSEVLSLPKLEECCDFDDEEWLISSKDGISLSVGPITKALETPTVWGEAMHIESADVYALPYVIPY